LAVAYDNVLRAEAAMAPNANPLGRDAQIDEVQRLSTPSLGKF
jgi:hypothetical protein